MNRKRAEEALLELEASPKGWRFDEVAHILSAFGIVFKNRTGSDCLYKHETIGVRVFISDHGSGPLKSGYIKKVVAAINKVKEAGG